ncbi:hypothetical protein M8J77_007092 [Diaphorina citri]|nr:hypothetical protein M8J77_007092 [Diaphorina citri]
MSESDNNSSCDEEMMMQPQHPQSPDPGHSHLMKPTKKLVFDSPEKQDSESWSQVNKPSINVMMFCDDEDKNGRMTPPQSNSTPIAKSHSSFTRYHMKPSLGDFPPTPKSFKSSLFINNSHLHTSRDSSKVLISNIFSPEGMCIESAKRQYHIKRQRQLLRSFDNVDTKSPTTTCRAADEDSGDDHHPVFDIKSISSTSIDHSRYALEFLEEELLGSGDFGEVFKCLKYMDGMTYAVKRTKRPVANTAQEKIFKKEIHAHALLSRVPHIVNYFSSWSDQGVLYLQLEYCNGGNLENIIQERCTFTEMALKQLLFQVSEGLRCMHEMRMIHMDIKPANILIVKAQGELNEPMNTEKLHYKLGDFGHVIADNDFEVEEGDCRYLPKELLNNNFDNLSKVDIFALGLTLYEASGVTPLPKNGPMWHHIRDGNIEKLSNVSDDLHTLIKLMIDKDPTKRPSAQEIIAMRSSPCCTSSLRRSAQLARNYPQLKVENIRGNLNTRLKKLDEGNVFDGIILAVAGIVRMKWKDRINEYLEPTSMMYAVGQGALAVECRDNDHFILSLLEPLHHQATVLRIIAERAFLNTLGGGCSAPVAVFSEYKPGSLSMTGAVWSLDGRETLQDAMERSLDGEENEVDGGQEVGSGEPARKSVHHDASTYFGIHPGFFKTGHLQCARHLGMSLAHELMDRGAIKIMSTAKQTINPKP